MTPRTRIAVAALGASAVFLVGRAVQEGYTDTAVIPVKGDRPTVGFGMTHRPDGSPVRMGDRTNPVEALQRTLAHVQKDESGLKRCVTAPLHLPEWDMLLDHAYQYGVGKTCGSEVVRLTNQERYAEACRAYLNWKYITLPGGRKFDCSTPGNKVCGGVWKDAQRRHRICMEAQ